MSPDVVTAVVRIGIDPEIHLGPVTLAWHGLTIALGVTAGALAAARCLRERGMDVAPIQAITLIGTVGGLLGARLFYLLEHDAGALLAPERAIASRGYTFDGGVILAALGIALYLRGKKDVAGYLDACGAGLGLGVAIGRIGDVINGEHYGEPSTFLLAVRNSHPDALTPNPALAYHNGGLYEVLLAAGIFALVWPLRHRLIYAGELAWLALGLFAFGRFFLFFLRSDSPELAVGLSNAQWTSVAMLLVVVLGSALTRARGYPVARRSAERQG